MIAIMFFIPIYNVTETTRCNGHLNCNIIGASGIARRRRKFLGFYIHFFQIPLYFGRFRTAKSLTETGIHPSKPGSTKPGSTKTGVHQTGVHQSRLLRKPRSTKPRSTKIFRKNRGPPKWKPRSTILKTRVPVFLQTRSYYLEKTLFRSVFWFSQLPR